MVQNGKGVASHKISFILSNENDDAIFDMIWYITISHKSVRKKKEKKISSRNFIQKRRIYICLLEYVLDLARNLKLIWHTYLLYFGIGKYDFQEGVTRK